MQFMQAVSFIYKLQGKHQILKFVTKHKRTIDMSADYFGSEKKMKSASADGAIGGGLKRGHVLEKNGDLFRCPPGDSLAHCISEDVNMGKGIATLFKKKFQGIQELLDQKQQPGGVAVLKRDGRYVYYLITKAKYWQKPTYATLESSLIAMKGHCLRNTVRRVSMPKIGCGLDGLEWEKVRDLLEKTFGGSDIAITVYTI